MKGMIDVLLFGVLAEESLESFGFEVVVANSTKITTHSVIYDLLKLSIMRLGHLKIICHNFYSNHPDFFVRIK